MAAIFNTKPINSFIFLLFALAAGFLGGLLANSFNQIVTDFNVQAPAIKVLTQPTSPKEPPPDSKIDPTQQLAQEELVVKVVKDVSPSVVSIIISKDLPVLEEVFLEPFREFGFPFRLPQLRQKGTEKREVAGGTGFIVSADGLVLTNKHVVLDKNAEYTVLLNDGRRFPAQVLARDPFQDLAVIKIQAAGLNQFKPLRLADSDQVQVGQSVIAIGNALGEFRNTVSVGVVSGLERRITASGAGFIETIDNLIQTDAAINRGNSGGPLLNLRGEVVGINTAVAQGAENIGFAIPANLARRNIEQVRATGKIVYPFLGVCWAQVNQTAAGQLKLPFNYGAAVLAGENCEQAIFPGSVAQKAGIKEGDVILEWNGQKLTEDNSLGKVIRAHKPGDKITLKIWREGKEFTLQVNLGERSE